MSTATGGVIDFLAPDPAAIDFFDIATSLSRIPRWNGHTVAGRKAWNVAEHSILVCGLAIRAGCSKRTALLALLHDAHEAFIGDLISPFKAAVRSLLADFGIGRAHCPLALIQGYLQRAIHCRCGLAEPTEAEASEIHAADLMALAIERAQLLRAAALPAGYTWIDLPTPPDDITLPECGGEFHSRTRFLLELRACCRDAGIEYPA